MTDSMSEREMDSESNSDWRTNAMLRAASAGVGEVAGNLLNERRDSFSSLDSDLDFEVVAHDTAGKSRGRTAYNSNTGGGSEKSRKKVEHTGNQGDNGTSQHHGDSRHGGDRPRSPVASSATNEDGHGNELYQGENGNRSSKREVSPHTSSQIGGSSTTTGSSTLNSSVSPLATLMKLEDALRSDEIEVQLEATKQIRQLLSVERDTHVQNVLDRDVVPQLLKFLKDKDHAALQVEALWALTNIAAGTTEHTHLLIKNNAVPTLVGLLDSNHSEVLEQAVWVLGNIAGDSHHTARDTVLRCGALAPLLNCMKDTKKTTLLRIATWTLSNLCDGQPRPVLDVTAVLDTIRYVLEETDTEVLSHACWALSHLCDGPSPHIQAVVHANVCERLVSLLQNKSWRVVKPALRTVGNIVCAEDDQDYTQRIIECGAVPYLRALVGNSNREIQKEACWTLSNIAAGTVDQIQCVLDSGAIPPLVELARAESDTDPDVKIEACWVLLNATSCGSDSQIQRLVQHGCVSVLCNLLEDSSMLLMALEGLEKILQVGDELVANSDSQLETNPHAAMLDTSKVKALQDHRSSAIAKRATAMWKQYFVLCAICNKAYTFHSPETSFCSECKCAVCRNCDCSIYHLSYQDKLWRDLQEGEAQKVKSKQKSKKSKRQKKRLKDKKKKKGLLKQQEDDGTEHRHNNDNGEKHQNSTGSESEDDPERGDGVNSEVKDGSTNATIPGQAVSGKANKECVEEHHSEQGSQHSKINGVPASKSNGGLQQVRMAAMTLNKTKKSDGNSPTRVCGKIESVAEIAPELLEESGEEHVNEEYVDFLLESGSILALSKKMDMENDGADEVSLTPL